MGFKPMKHIAYQDKAIQDLRDYLALLDETRSLPEAYRAYWEAKDFRIGDRGIAPYRDAITGTPHVCFKVPTGGGKTYMACLAVKPIIETVKPNRLSQVVVWLVPSTSILEQTIRNLKDVEHPYRRRLDQDFYGRVGVYTKEELLGGQNFSPDTIHAQLTICVLSYDSIRSNKKDGRKVYQENGQLSRFEPTFQIPEALLDGIDSSALIQVLGQQAPVVIVDESHNARSDLSVEMLRNLNPSFVLDLTATPRENSNIITFVDARQLKKENMVKLPLLVYNRSSVDDVIKDAIKLRGNLERFAVEAEARGGEYIRPIVLFQAQPKGKEDATTFEKLRDELTAAGIPREQIAIKTTNINEIANIDLLDRGCKIRYIITVNALKEGWDCPFAYILATLANKSSRVDVEQIIGRVLRQPYAKPHGPLLLNNSYVLTCSSAFAETLDNIINALKLAGFSRKELRFQDPEPVIDELAPIPPFSLDTQLALEPAEDDGPLFDPSIIRGELEQTAGTDRDASIDEIMEHAQQQIKAYEEQARQDEAQGLGASELEDKMIRYPIAEPFRADAAALGIPMFFLRTEKSIFHAEEYTLLSKEALSSGFSLRSADSNVNFALSSGEVISIDLAETGDAIPTYQRLRQRESALLREQMEREPDEKKFSLCISSICGIIEQSRRVGDFVNSRELRNYVERVLSGLGNDEVTSLQESVQFYALRIIGKIEALLDAYREGKFVSLLDADEIVCRPHYTPPQTISPTEPFDSLFKSLYEAESGKMNSTERQVIEMIAGLRIRWWHRIVDRKDYSFRINGFITHYPDFMVMTEKGNLLLIEVKGDDRDNSDSKRKLRLGRRWQSAAGKGYRYFMVFDKNEWKIDGAYPLAEFMNIAEKL
jgi:type III restriction enzyme